MNFITLTGDSEDRIIINIDHICSVGRVCKFLGGKLVVGKNALVMLTNGQNIAVKETQEDVKEKIKEAGGAVC